MQRTRLSWLTCAKWLKIHSRTCTSELPPAKTPVSVSEPEYLERGICVLDPCEVNTCYKSPRVVVIGAGMAGLTAAGRLADRGIDDVTVLEAYERPGGRIYSCWMGDVVAELGAHWKSDFCCDHPLYRVSTTMKEFQPGPLQEALASKHPRGLFTNVVTGKMEIPTTITAFYKFKLIEQEAAQLFCLGGPKQHGSIINFMSMRIQQDLHEFPEEQQHDAARIMFGLSHMLNARSNQDTGMLCADCNSCFMSMPGGEVRVPLGLIGMLAPVMRQIPEGSIRYCKPVSVIYWGTCQKHGYRATVVTEDGEEFPCDYVIITVSLGVLCNKCMTLFCPSLPSYKMDAMRCLGFGSCNKVFLEYSQPFCNWQKGKLNFKFNESELCHRCDWTSGIKAIEEVPNSRHVLCAWIIGAEAYMMECLCDRDIIDGITDVLRMTTRNPDVPHPSHILRSNWTSDPFFYGAYSFEVQETNGAAQRGLGDPLPGPGEPVPPILLFAGEATVPGHYATIAGARLSGVREAERILELTRHYKGPPIPNVPVPSKCLDMKKEAEKEKAKNKN